MSVPIVAVVGAGGIGHPAIAALSDAPIRLRVIDDDRVEISNLHRLPFANDGDIGSFKADVALRARARSGDEAIHERVVPDRAASLLEGASLVIEGSDNYPTKFLVADACGLLGVPSVHGAAVSWIGTVLPVLPRASACYRCVFEDVPEGDTVDCTSAGVFGPVTALIGAVMAREALRLLEGDARFAGNLAHYDGWRQTFRSSAFRRRPDCALCGTRAIRRIDAARYIRPACAS